LPITPRKDEIEAVATILESPDYASVESMARDLIKQVSVLLARRSSFGVYAELEGPVRAGFSLGPYWSKADAERALESAATAGCRGFVAALHSTDAVRPIVDHAVKVCACGHRPEIHVARHGCAVYRCKCSVFETRFDPNPVRGLQLAP
jgi:hypothetical protein